MSNRRNPYSLSDFSLRRLLLQGARAARGSPQLGTRLCDVERGSVKYDKSHPSTSGSNSSNKVCVYASTTTNTITMYTWCQYYLRTAQRKQQKHV